MKIKPGMRRWISATMIGMIATASLHAQEAPAGKPRAFYISESVVTDREGMKPYSAQVESTVLPFGGHIVEGTVIAARACAPGGRTRAAAVSTT
ncbi:MAG: hypothetical protein JWQ80_1132 [Massilia sp.]|nr:hypothetical protein [Massilia sp.]